MILKACLNVKTFKTFQVNGAGSQVLVRIVQCICYGDSKSTASILVYSSYLISPIICQ